MGKRRHGADAPLVGRLSLTRAGETQVLSHMRRATKSTTGRDPGDDPSGGPAVAVGARGISSMPLLMQGHTGAHTAVRALSQHGSLADVGGSTHVEVSLEGSVWA
jgi:hypothetical protein